MLLASVQLWCLGPSIPTVSVLGKCSFHSRDPGEPPSAKRKQIEMQKRRLDSLKRMDERYKSLEKKTKDDEEEAAAKAKEPKLSLSAKQEKVKI